MISSADVAAAKFAPVRFREGYEMSGVDSLLAKVRNTLLSYEQRTGAPAALSATDVVNSRFQPTKFREGYAQDEVDNLLDQVVAALRTYEGTGQPTIL
jgi:DivIVA domain-containing protein